MRNILFLLTVSQLAVQTCPGDLILLEDTFGGPAVSRGRFASSDIAARNWVQRGNSGGTPTPSTWTVSGGELTNPANTAGNNDDQGVHLLGNIANTETSLTQVEVSFEYEVGLGSTLYFHSSLFTGNYADTGSDPRLTRDDGTYFAQDFNDQFDASFNLNGNPANGATANALVSLAGMTSGTFTQTYDITAFTGIDSIADITHILAVFTAETEIDVVNDGAILIENFTVRATAVPEPSSFALMVGVVVCFAARRRWRQVKAAA